MRAENRVLKSSGAVKHNQASSAASSVSVATPNEDGATLRDFRGAGKQYTILSDLWPQRSILRRPCPPNFDSFGPWDLRRCANDTAWDQGNVAELYHLLPERYHEFIEHSALFSDQVCTHLVQYN